MIEFTLPFPPSVNGLFAGKSRRFKSRAYRSWITAAGWEIARQRVRAAPGPVDISIALRPPDKRGRDADNYIKAILDLIVSHSLLPDDSAGHVQSVMATWAQHPGAPGAVVRIMPAEGRLPRRGRAPACARRRGSELADGPGVSMSAVSLAAKVSFVKSGVDDE